MAKESSNISNRVRRTVLHTACPHLPQVTEARTASTLRVYRGKRKDTDFYRTTLECAQSRWQCGLPAQALLMLNRALSVNFKHWSERERQTLATYPPPYRALAWILEKDEKHGFLGNPRRHFQHLATRMTGANHDLRVARAWACWAIVRKMRPDFIADEKQLSEENLIEPTLERISGDLKAATIPSEHQVWEAVIHG